MTMGGTEAPCIYLDLQSIRLPEDAPKQLTPELCERVRLTTDIQADRIYINYQDAAPTHWGWNGKTFA